MMFQNCITFGRLQLRDGRCPRVVEEAGDGSRGESLKGSVGSRAIGVHY